MTRPPPPSASYPCRRVDRVMAGDFLGDSDWARAPALELRDVVDGAPPRQRTTAALLWNDQHLFARFDASDTEILADCREPDGAVWEDDCVALFVDPYGLGRVYYELEVNALGTVLDALVINRQRGDQAARDISTLSQWCCTGLRHRVTALEEGSGREPADDIGRGYRVHLAIPLDQLAPVRPPAAGEAWGLNLFRVDRSRETLDLQAWRPTGRRDFHRPECFGRLLFHDDQA